MIKIALPNGKFIQVKEAQVTPEEARQYQEYSRIMEPLSLGVVGGGIGTIVARKGTRLGGGILGAALGLGLGALYAPIHTRLMLGKSGRKALRKYREMELQKVIKERLGESPEWMKRIPDPHITAIPF